MAEDKQLKTLDEITEEEIVEILKIVELTGKRVKTLNGARHHIADKWKDCVTLGENEVYGATVEITTSNITRTPYREHNPETTLLNNQFQVAKYLIERGYKL